MKNILLIINDLSLCCKINKALRMKQFHLISTNNNWEGIRLVEEQYPEIIITDLNILQTDKYCLLRKLREITFFSDTPILLLNNQINKQFCLKAWRLGIDWYFPNTAELDLIIQSICHKIE